MCNFATVRQVWFLLFSFVFASNALADELVTHPNQAETSIEFNYSEFYTSISNTDSGNTSGLNNAFQGKINFALDAETQLFFSGEYNSTGQNNFNIGMTVLPNDLFSLSISAGEETEKLTYYNGDYPSTIVSDPLHLMVVTIRPAFNAYQNKTVKIELASGLSVFLPGSNSTYSVPFNARSRTEVNVEKKMNDTLSVRTGLFFQNQEHVTDFFNQTQNDLGLSFGMKWNLF
jgi:hypothetical protein